MQGRSDFQYSRPLLFALSQIVLSPRLSTEDLELWRDCVRALKKLLGILESVWDNSQLI
jgi:hypothetical protein